MAGTRNGNNSSPAKSNDASVAGSKRKPEADADAESSPKRGRKASKNQPTIDSMLDHTDEKADKDAEMQKSAQDVAEDAENDKQAVDSSEQPAKDEGDTTAREKGTEANDTNGQEASDKVESTPDARTEEATEAAGNGAIEESSQREKKIPSSILEKGIIYFFTRNRVSVDEAESVDDLQRTFFVLRPLPPGAKLTDGALQDTANNRLLALPKKVFPKSHTDRFMAFVEKSNTTIKDLKESFFQGSEYTTQTQGTRHNDPVTPVAEGVYLLTHTADKSTHLAYSTTIPSSPGAVQQDLGIAPHGSFLLSVKNPDRSGPASAALPQKPAFPKSLMEAFQGRAWGPVQPAHLDCEYCQILLIGEDKEKGVQGTRKDEKQGKETPGEEMEELEHEDELRVQHLDGDDSVFEDLKISRDEYPQVPTTW